MNPSSPFVGTTPARVYTQMAQRAFDSLLETLGASRGEFPLRFQVSVIEPGIAAYRQIQTGWHPVGERPLLRLLTRLAKSIELRDNPQQLFARVDEARRAGLLRPATLGSKAFVQVGDQVRGQERQVTIRGLELIEGAYDSKSGRPVDFVIASDWRSQTRRHLLHLEGSWARKSTVSVSHDLAANTNKQRIATLREVLPAIRRDLSLLGSERVGGAFGGIAEAVQVVRFVEAHRLSSAAVMLLQDAAAGRYGSRIGSYTSDDLRDERRALRVRIRDILATQGASAMPSKSMTVAGSELLHAALSSESSPIWERLREINRDLSKKRAPTISPPHGA